MRKEGGLREKGVKVSPLFRGGGKEGETSFIVALKVKEERDRTPLERKKGGGEVYNRKKVIGED